MYSDNIDHNHVHVLHMTCTSKLQNNIRNGFPILDNPTKVLSFMFMTLLVLKLLKCPTSDGGHLGFVQYGRHSGSPSWLPREIGRRWLYPPPGPKMVLVERFEQLFD